MDADQNAGTGGGDLSYQQRGDDRTDDLTRRDEASMDRAAQAGFDGAFDAAANPDATRESMRQDAADAFGGAVSDTGGGAGGATGGGAGGAASGGDAGAASGNAGGAAGGGVVAHSLNPTPGGGVSLGDVPAGSSPAAGAEADKDLAGASGSGGAGTDSMAAGDIGA
jgi:hypothetical protein